MDSAQKLKDFLIQEWSIGLRLTTIPQAMERLGMADDCRRRRQLATELGELWHQVLTSPEKRGQIAEALGRPLDEGQEERWSDQTRTWHMASILLTEGEKLVARHILMCRRDGGRLPYPTETAQALRMPLRGVHNGLRMLASTGFLVVPDKRRLGDYRLANDHQRFVEGLGFSFHTVSLDTGERFGVP